MPPASTARYFTGAAAVGVVMLVSWLTISPGTPRFYAPYNHLLVDALFMVPSRILAVAVVPLFFCAWCWPLLRGDSSLPMRSIVLLLLCVLLSAATFISGFIQCLVLDHSVSLVAGVAAINVVCWALLATLASLARRRPSFYRALAFHAALFAWLASYGIPYFGVLR